MAEGLNRVMLIGNLGADPELKYTQNGQGVLRLRLATTESYMNRAGERQQRTDWHTVTVWGKRGEALNNILSKGRSICVEGRIPEEVRAELTARGHLVSAVGDWSSQNVCCVRSEGGVLSVNIPSFVRDIAFKVKPHS